MIALYGALEPLRVANRFAGPTFSWRFISADGQPVAAGQGRALLLGPLAVRPAHKNVGIGRKLVRIAIDAAGQASQPAVLLVGDAPYYGPLGFSKMPPGQIVMPGPVDPHRMLGLELTAGSLALLGGPLVHQSLVRCRTG